jgi:hypothetical protein
MSTYSTTLRIELIGAGEQDGTWGDTTNSNLGDLIEAAITNVVDITFANAQYTLSANNGLPDEARNAVLNLIGTNSGAQNLIAPAVEKTYIIKNATGASVTIKTSGGTGVAIATGTTQIVWCDGTDFYTASLPSGATTGTGSVVYSASPTLTGVPLAPTANAGTNTTQIATTAFVNTAVTTLSSTLGTMSTQNASAVTITGGSITGITDLTVADGGTGASTFTTNSVVLGNGTSSLAGNMIAPSTSGNVLASNGTTWGSSALSSLSAFDKSLSTNGYQKLPGGLIMQWGQVEIPGDGDGTVTWPIAFPTACFQAVGSHGQTFNVSTDGAIGFFNLSTTTATVRNGLGATSLIRWIAFGY